MTLQTFQPDFQSDCRICGTSPCVIVVGHPQPETSLCGIHFFLDGTAADWQEWNEREDESDQPTEDSPE